MSMDSKTKWEYFSRRLETTWDMYLEFLKSLDAKFSEEWKAFYKSRDEQTYQEYLREIEFPYRNTLNSSMLIAFCSLTEHVLTDIAMENVEKYEEKKKQKKGNWLVTNLELLKECGVDINQNSGDVILFSHYIKIRNCVVHNGGRISNSNSKRQSQLENAIKAVEKYSDMITIKDDYLMIGDYLISDVVVKSEEIIDDIMLKLERADA